MVNNSFPVLTVCDQFLSIVHPFGISFKSLRPLLRPFGSSLFYGFRNCVQARFNRHIPVADKVIGIYHKSCLFYHFWEKCSLFVWWHTMMELCTYFPKITRTCTVAEVCVKEMQIDRKENKYNNTSFSNSPGCIWVLICFA